MENLNQTQCFDGLEKEIENEAKNILLSVSEALKEKGDPTYITSHKNARSLIRKLERDELLEELIQDYLERN